MTKGSRGHTMGQAHKSLDKSCTESKFLISSLFSAQSPPYEKSIKLTKVYISPTPPFIFIF